MQKVLILFLFICSFQAIGQTISPENRIVVLGSSEIEIPADRVIFQVKLFFKDEFDVKKAFTQHKEAESKLVSFLKDLQIPNKNINYTLIKIDRSQLDDDNNRNLRKQYYITQQTVQITLDNVKDYSDFTLKLISAGFNDINASFESSKVNDFHGQLLEKAIEIASKQAQVMAKVSKRKLGRILKISDTDESEPNFTYHWRFQRGRGDYNFSDLNEINTLDITSIAQTIKKNMNVKVIFELK